MSTTSPTRLNAAEHGVYVIDGHRFPVRELRLKGGRVCFDVRITVGTTTLFTPDAVEELLGPDGTAVASISDLRPVASYAAAQPEERFFLDVGDYADLTIRLNLAWDDKLVDWD